MEARILESVVGDGDGLFVFGHPSRYALSHAELQAVHHLSVWVLGGPKNKIVLLQDVDEAGIAIHDGGDEFDDALQNFMKRVGGGDTPSNLM